MWIPAATWSIDAFLEQDNLEINNTFWRNPEFNADSLIIIIVLCKTILYMKIKYTIILQNLKSVLISMSRLQNGTE